MSSQFLQTELSNLIQESKRKNSDLRNVHLYSESRIRASLTVKDIGRGAIIERIEGVALYF